MYMGLRRGEARGQETESTEVWVLNMGSEVADHLFTHGAWDTKSR